MVLFFLVIPSSYAQSVTPDDLHHMFINDSPPLIVDWTPKAGCTVVWKTLLKNYGLYDKAMAYNPWIHWYRIGVYSLAHRATVEKFLDKNYIKIKFVRCPYQRAVSSYLYVDASKPYQFSESASSYLTFEEFLLALLAHNHTAKPIKNNVDGVFYHSQPQNKPTDFFMDRIIKIEESAVALEEINKRLGLQLNISSETSFHHRNYCDKGSRYVGNHIFTTEDKAFPPFYCFYSPKTLRLVQTLYGEDIARYHYDIPPQIARFIRKNKWSKQDR